MLHSGLSLEQNLSCGLLTHTCGASNAQLGALARPVPAPDNFSGVSTAQPASAGPVLPLRALLMPHVTSTRIPVGQVNGTSRILYPGPEARDDDSELKEGATAWGGVSLTSRLSLTIPISEVRGPDNSQAISIGRFQDPMVSLQYPRSAERPREGPSQAVSGYPSPESRQSPPAPTIEISCQAVALFDGHHTGAIDDQGPPQLIGAPGGHDRAIPDDVKSEVDALVARKRGLRAAEVQHAGAGGANGLDAVDSRQMGRAQMMAKFNPLNRSRQALVQTEVALAAREMTRGGGVAGVLRPAACDAEQVT